ncbi:MAG: 4-hydroxybenzoyl-CoA reductase subunit beta [Polyangiaceae bacterium]|nr:4-hydroxybenzoyl-CoA reductase subunit beta [Polyangiaceae bacterium]
MLPLPAFKLHRPRTIEEAAALLAQLGDRARLVAGGTDIVPNMKHGLVDAKALVSLQQVEALRGIKEENGALVIGAMTNLDAVADDARIRETAPALAEAAAGVGGPHHRRMGTLGGNLCLDTRCRYYNQTYFWRSALGFCLKKDGSVCHVVAGGQKCVAAASNDTAPALIALDASIVLESVRGRREVEAKSFYTADGIRNTVLERDEIVAGVRVPLAAGRRSAFDKLRRRNAIDFPLLSVAARADVADGKVSAIEVVVSALAARPRQLKAAQKIQAGTAATGELVSRLAEASKRECKPLDNVEGDPDWRHDMVPIVVGRVLSRALGLSG